LGGAPSVPAPGRLSEIGWGKRRVQVACCSAVVDEVGAFDDGEWAVTLAFRGGAGFPQCAAGETHSRRRLRCCWGPFAWPPSQCALDRTVWGRLQSRHITPRLQQRTFRNTSQRTHQGRRTCERSTAGSLLRQPQLSDPVLHHGIMAAKNLRTFMRLWFAPLLLARGQRRAPEPSVRQ